MSEDEEITNSVGMKLRLIQHGSFMMGSLIQEYPDFSYHDIGFRVVSEVGEAGKPEPEASQKPGVGLTAALKYQEEGEWVSFLNEYLHARQNLDFQKLSVLLCHDELICLRHKWMVEAVDHPAIIAWERARWRNAQWRIETVEVDYDQEAVARAEIRFKPDGPLTTWSIRLFLLDVIKLAEVSLISPDKVDTEFALSFWATPEISDFASIECTQTVIGKFRHEQRKDKDTGEYYKVIVMVTIDPETGAIMQRIVTEEEIKKMNEEEEQTRLLIDKPDAISFFIRRGAEADGGYECFTSYLGPNERRFSRKNIDELSSFVETILGKIKKENPEGWHKTSIYIVSMEGPPFDGLVDVLGELEEIQRTFEPQFPDFIPESERRFKICIPSADRVEEIVGKCSEFYPELFDK